MKIRERQFFIFVLSTLFLLTTVLAVALCANAQEQSGQIDAMREIGEEMKDFIQGDTQVFDDDGYIGISYEITVYYDNLTFDATIPGYNGTPVILYVVNSGAERIGTDSDVEIITSMLERGYVVAVLDYKNSAKATNPDLEYSVQKIRTKLKNGNFFTDKEIFPSGIYYENHVVPAGHNITLNHVFYEIDKHGIDGSLEKIVEVWNVDFRGCKRDVIIKWVDEDGNRKTTQNGFGGEAPVWYSDAEGKTVDNENGQYTKIQYTKAMKITDCVKKDGSLIDFNLYMDIIYPTSPIESAPVMMLACSGEHLASGYALEDRPHLVRYSMSGYATAIFDYEYIPMARDDHYGTFSGAISGGITGADGTFALGIFNRSNYQTAAVRYLRSLAFTDSSTYSFDTEAFGIFGNSKGGFQTFLGAEELRASAAQSDIGEGASEFDLMEYVDAKVSHFFNESYITATDPETNDLLKFDGNSRYQNNKTDDLAIGDFIVDGGELQPWLIYTDSEGITREIPSGVQFVYSSCGGTTTQEWAGHSPVFTASNYYDEFGSGYTTHNYLANIFRIYDVPSMFFEAPLKHSFVSGADVNYGVDTYEALFKFTDYYLKDTAVSVAYTVPSDKDAFVETTDEILIKFYGEVSREQIANIKITDSDGNAANGEWVASHGNTEWRFLPESLNGGVKYTALVPSSLVGVNGIARDSDYSFDFYTVDETIEVLESVDKLLTDVEGTHISFAVPADFINNSYKLRVKIGNDAANTMLIYEANGADDTNGQIIGCVNISGKGYYEYDVTDYIMSKSSGSTVYFYVKAGKAPADTVIYSNDFDNTKDFTVSKVSSSLVNEIDGEAITALRAVSTNYSGWYPAVLQNSKVINNGSPITTDDYGRTFTFTLRVYDTASRPLQLWFNDCTNGSENIGDYSYSRATTHTVANEWMDVSVDYTVYESLYGIDSQVKNFKVIMLSTGSSEKPIYFDSLEVTEHITSIDLVDASLILSAKGDSEIKAPDSLYAFDVGGIFYSTWDDALKAITDNATVKFLRSYSFDNGSTATLTKNNITVDLNGYTAFTFGSSLLNLYGENSSDAQYTVKNGNIVVKGSSVISYEGSLASVSSKEYSITLENVHVEVDKAYTRDIITTFSSAENAIISENISFIDSTIYINRTNLPSGQVSLFNIGGGNAVARYTLTGGKLICPSLLKLTLWNNPDELTFKANANGEYTDIIVSESQSISTDKTVMSDSGYAYFTLESTSDGQSTYSLARAKYSTVYGVIPDEFSPEEYPFAVFSNGEFLDAYKAYSIGNDNLDNALAKPWKYIRGEHNTEVQILLRADYDMTADGNGDSAFQNICQIGGTLVIDLNGFTLTLKDGVPFINNIGKYGYDAALSKNHVYDTNIIIRGNGGGIITDSTPIINFESQVCTTATQIERYDEKKITNVLFDGVSIDSSVAIISAGTRVNTQFGADLNVNFVDCEFELSGVNANTVLFTGLDSSGMNNLHVRMIGGNISISSLDGITLSSLDEGDSVVFGKNGDGKYTTLTAPTSYDLPEFGGIAENGQHLVFTDGAVSGSNTVYTLGVNDLATDYGTIPDEYENPDEYPWIVFTNGSFYGAYTKFADSNDNDGVNSALEAARKILLGTNSGSKSAQIILRSNYDMNDQADNFGNLCHIGGTLTIDLGIHTFTTNSNPMFKMDVKHGGYPTTSNGIYDSNIKIIGGTIIPNTTLITFSTISSASRYEAIKHSYFTFKGTKFVIPASGNTVPFIKATGTAATDTNSGRTNNAYLIVNFNDCTFDLTANTKNLTLFNANDSLNKYDVTVNVNGGKFEADMSKITLWNLNSSNDKVVFGKGSDGRYPEILTESTLSSALAFVTDGGNMYYTKVGTDGNVGVYHLGELTEYGIIAEDYLDAERYPWIVFDGNGNFVYATDKLGVDNPIDKTNASALMQAKWQILSGKTPVILLRRDFVIHDTFNNLSQVESKVYIDLGGHTLSSAVGYIFNADAKNAYVNGKKYIANTEIVIYNGIINASVPVILYKTTANVDNYSEIKNFVFTFDDVRFIASGNINGGIISSVGSFANSKNRVGLEILMNDCVIDASELTDSFALFGGVDAKKLLDISVTINGGQIIAGHSDFEIASVDDGDSLVFGKDTGDYTTLSLPAGTQCCNVEMLLDSGLYGAFVLNETDIEHSTFVIKPRLIKDFGIKSNITLYTSFEFNLYIPAVDTIKTITIDGDIYSIFSELETKVIDGELYYVITKYVPVASAADNYTVKITLVDTNDSQITGTWTVGVVKYLQALMNKTANDLDRDMAMDILSYIRAIYVYNNSNLDVISFISSMLSENYDDISVPDMNVEAVQKTDGLASASLELGDAPSFRFYLDGTYDASRYKFTVNGARAKTNICTTEDSRVYIQVILYACYMTDTVSYTIDGTDICGEYNLKSYYNSILDRNEPALTSLIERLWKYSQSAAQYKQRVVDNANTKVHKYAQTYDASLGYEIERCEDCSAWQMKISNSEMIEFAADCSGKISFDLNILSDSAEITVYFNGNPVRTENYGKGAHTITVANNLAEGSYTFGFSVSNSDKEVYLTDVSVDGTMYRKDGIILELTESNASHGGIYNDFYVYVQTSDSSKEYYIRYRFEHEYSVSLTGNVNSSNNSNMFRVVGAELVRVNSVSNGVIDYTSINSLLTSGEIAVAIKEPDTVDFIGGYHGEEQIIALTMLADGVEYIPGATADVVVCSKLQFDQLTVINRCNTPEDKILNHNQSYSITTNGLSCLRSIEWLTDGFEYSSAYLNMFTMLRKDGDSPICNAVETFDKDGNSLGKATVDSVGSSDKHIMQNTDATMVRYTSDISGFSAVVSYEILNDSVAADTVFIATRKDSIGDNKWYAGFKSTDGSKISRAGEIWQLDVLYHIDYVEQ